MTELELVIDAKARLAEGPSWDADEKRLYWVDIEGFKLHIYDPSSGRDTVHEVGQHIGAVVPYDQDRVMVALKVGSIGMIWLRANLPCFIIRKVIGMITGLMMENVIRRAGFGRER